MERTSFFRVGASVVPTLWIWIQMFIFHEAVFWISEVSYIGIFSLYSLLVLLSLSDEILGNKISKMDQEAQTETHGMNDQSVQTEDFLISAIKPEEREKEVYEYGKVDDILTSETQTIEDDFAEIEESSSTEIDSDSHDLPDFSHLPEPLASEAAVAASLGIKTTVKKLKFFLPTDPSLLIDDEVPMKDGKKDDKVAQWYLKYIKEKHEEKQKEKLLSFFQRKERKINKRFKKKENK